MITDAQIMAALAVLRASGSLNRAVMRRALEASERAAWQDIETAPHDRPVDLWVEHWHSIPFMERSARWSGQHWLTPNSNVIDYDDGQGRWIKPTKWRPLPSPPADVRTRT